MSDVMRSSEALEVLIDVAARWAENMEEAFPRRIETTDSDETCAQLAEMDGEWDSADIILVRDVWRAVELAQSMRSQRGCEGFDPAIEAPGYLTDLMDIVIFG